MPRQRATFATRARRDGGGAVDDTVADPVQHAAQVLAWHRQEVFRHLALIADGIQRTLGDAAEVVVHDFRDPEHSIVHIAGDVTGRKVGGSITDLGLELLEGGKDVGVLIYQSKAPDGTPLKSTSVILTDADGLPMGALCININVQGAEQAARLLQQLVSVPAPDPVHETYADDPAAIVSGILREELDRRGMDGSRLTRDERIEIVGALKGRGVFNLRNAASIVAEQLGVSRFSIYKYLGSAETGVTAGNRL